MILLLAPWALIGGLLLAGPILVHMLLRRNARRVIFPATHFVPSTRAAAVRFRRPSDVALLALRLAIVAAAVLAAASPLLLTGWRRAQWNARTVRAVIIEARPGAQSDDGMRLAAQEMAAVAAERFTTADLRDALARAALWLEQAPPGRREVVIVSDFQKGDLDAEDLRVLPEGTGIHPIRVATAPLAREVALAPVSGFRGGRWQPSLRLDGDGSAVTWTRTGDAAPLTWLTTEQAPTDGESARRAVSAAVSVGVAAGDDTREVRVRFAGAQGTPGAQPLRTRWMIDAALSLRRQPLLAEANATAKASEQDGRLLVETNVTAASAAAPAVVRAVLLAVRPATLANRHAEVATISDAELARWRRDAAPAADPSGAAYAGVVTDSDARWLWLLALLLLGVEAGVRRARNGSSTVRVRDAA